MSPDKHTEIYDLTADTDSAVTPVRVILSFDPAAADALDDLLTVGRGRPRGQALSPIEQALRDALRSGLRRVRE